MIVDIDKRMFYLMLSVTEGQSFASSMGFSTPSEEVQEMEIMDILSRWLMLATAGVLEIAYESAEWFREFLVENEKLSAPEEDFTNAITVFGVALLNKLMDTGIVGLVVSDKVLEEIQELTRGKDE